MLSVPPDIMDDASTSDVTVNEGDNVTLTCVAKGKTHFNPREENSDKHNISGSVWKKR